MAVFVIRTVPTGCKFDLYADNGQTVLTSEVYRTAAACRKGILSIRKNAPAAPVEEEGEPPCPNPKFQLYRDRAGAYRFRLRARNGAIIASSEPYAAKGGCLGGIESVKTAAPTAGVEEALIKLL